MGIVPYEGIDSECRDTRPRVSVETAYEYADTAGAISLRFHKETACGIRRRFT